MFGAVIFILSQIFLGGVQSCEPTCLCLNKTLAENTSSSNKQWVGVKQTFHMCMFEHECICSAVQSDGFKNVFQNDGFHGDCVLEENSQNCVYTLKGGPLEEDSLKCTYLCKAEVSLEIKPCDDHVLREQSQIDEHVVKGDLNSCQGMLLNLLSLCSEGLCMLEVQKEYMQWSSGYGPKAPGEMMEGCSIYLWSNISMEQWRWPQGPYIDDGLFYSGGDGPKAQMLEGPLVGSPVECLKLACWVEGVVLVADYLNNVPWRYLIVMEKFAQLDSCFQRACVVESCVVAVNPLDEEERQEEPQKKSKVENLRVHLSISCTQKLFGAMGIGTSHRNALRIGASDVSDVSDDALGIGASDISDDGAMRMGASEDSCISVQHLLATADIRDIYVQEIDLLTMKIGLSQRLGLPSEIRDAFVQFLCACLTVFGHMFMSMFRQQTQQPEQQSEMMRRRAFLACCSRGRRRWRKECPKEMGHKKDKSGQLDVGHSVVRRAADVMCNDIRAGD